MADNMTHCVRCGDPFEMAAGAPAGERVCKKCQLKEQERTARAAGGPDAVDADAFEQEALKAELQDAQKVVKADDMPSQEKESAQRIVDTPHGQSVLKGVEGQTPAEESPAAPAPSGAPVAPAPAAPVRAADMPSAPAPSTVSETPIRPRQPGAVPRPNTPTPREPEK